MADTAAAGGGGGGGGGGSVKREYTVREYKRGGLSSTSTLAVLPLGLKLVDVDDPADAEVLQFATMSAYDTGGSLGSAVSRRRRRTLLPPHPFLRVLSCCRLSRPGWPAGGERQQLDGDLHAADGARREVRAAGARQVRDIDYPQH